MLKKFAFDKLNLQGMYTYAAEKVPPEKFGKIHFSDRTASCHPQRRRKRPKLLLPRRPFFLVTDSKLLPEGRSDSQFSPGLIFSEQNNAALKRSHGSEHQFDSSNYTV